jgi:uncharacterized repeat protein (TIGR04138 family)
MMQQNAFAEIVRAIRKDNPRYDEEAYLFIRESLDFTVKFLNKPAEGPKRHISGAELLEGIRRYALQEFGPMALTVLREWGVQRTRDFGEIVFQLVGKGVLGKTDEDSVDDFDAVYDFDEAFAKPFQPKAHPRPHPARRAPRRSRGRPPQAPADA